MESYRSFARQKVVICRDNVAMKATTGIEPMSCSDRLTGGRDVS